MITIISGTPGAGKTALVVDMMMDELKKGRKIFTIGIPKLLLNVNEGGDSHTWQEGSWLEIDKYDPELTKSKGIKSTWFPRGCSQSCPFLSTCPRYSHETPDAGSLIIIDEAHTDFPQRSSGKTPPDYVQALTVHRHQGLDFWFLTQRPSFLDPFIRGLSSRHIHLALNAFSFTGQRSRFEWAEYQETVNKTSKLLAAKSDYKPSPAVFPLYASATIHTKLDQKMPTILKAFIGFALVLIIASGYAVYRVKSRVDSVTHPVASGALSAASVPALPPTSSGGIQADGARAAQRSGAGGAAAAASLFDNVPALLPTPLVSSCLATKKKCQCYTDRGIKVSLTETECRDSAANLNDRFKLPDPDSKKLPSVLAALP